MFSDVFSVPLTDSKGNRKKQKKHRKRVKKQIKKERTDDADYLPELWNLSSNIFSVGVMVFILLNGYPPFENATIKDRWYKEIVKNKFHKFWKLHRASPINAIPIPSAPISFTPSTMNVLSPRSLFTGKLSINKAAPMLPSSKQKSVSSNNLLPSPFSPNSPNSPNTSIPNIFSDDENMKNSKKRTGPYIPSLKVEKSRSSNNVFESSDNDKNRNKNENNKTRKTKKKKKERVEYDYRSIQGLMNDLLRYNSWSRLDAFFNYNHNDLDFNDNLQALYHKYWFLDIGYNEDDQYNDNNNNSYNFDNIIINHNDNKQQIDEKEMKFLNVLNKLRYDKQEENRKKARNKDIDNDSISKRKGIFWIMDKQQKDPEYYPYKKELEGLGLNGSAELYTTKPWTDVFHEMYHIITNKCRGNVDKKYENNYKRLICKIKLASNKKEEKEQQKSEKIIIFEISIWKSVKYKDLNTTNDDTIYIVQWRRLYGNTLDYARVINHVIHEHCCTLFYLPTNIRRCMKSVNFVM